MKLYFYRGQHPNFGDELNLTLIPKVFGPLLDEGQDGKLLLAIGSILFDSHPKDVTKLVFGSGYGGYASPPVIDANWRFYCVRGPRSAEVCGLGPEMVAGDAAILIARYRSGKARKSIRYSFMPHWESIRRGHWRQACKLAGIHYLDPRRPVEELLAEIEASEVIVTEAMHGAIVADALRTPWVAIKPFHSEHRFKWFDWAGALDLDLRFASLLPSSLIEARLAMQGTERSASVSRTGMLGMAEKAIDIGFVAAAAASLRRATTLEPQLSSDAAMGRVLDKLETAAARLTADHAR